MTVAFLEKKSGDHSWLKSVKKKYYWKKSHLDEKWVLVNVLLQWEYIVS